MHGGRVRVNERDWSRGMERGVCRIPRYSQFTIKHPMSQEESLGYLSKVKTNGFDHVTGFQEETHGNC